MARDLRAEQGRRMTPWVSEKISKRVRVTKWVPGQPRGTRRITHTFFTKPELRDSTRAAQLVLAALEAGQIPERASVRGLLRAAQTVARRNGWHVNSTISEVQK
jgi:hypothetical protein